MKSILIAASIMAVCAASVRAENLFIMPDGSMDSMPQRGMQVYEPPATKYQASLDISTENPAHGTGALRVECEQGVYVSISFPMSTARNTGRARVYLRGDLVDAEEVTIGVQSFTMDGGFNSVSLIPVIDAKARIGAEWQHYTFDLKRDPDATHWQLSFILRGPGVLWIDHLEEVTD
jgi:hypothetical protein